MRCPRLTRKAADVGSHWGSGTHRRGIFAHFLAIASAENQAKDHRLKDNQLNKPRVNSFFDCGGERLSVTPRDVYRYRLFLIAITFAQWMSIVLRYQVHS